jgi:hypothetical protein
MVNGNCKTCSRCKNSKPATTDHFYKSNTGKYGIGSMCKECYKTPTFKSTTNDTNYTTKLKIYLNSGEVFEHENFSSFVVSNGFLKIIHASENKVYNYNISNIIRFDELILD